MPRSRWELALSRRPRPVKHVAPAKRSAVGAQVTSAVLLTLVACSGKQSTLQYESTSTKDIAYLWWFMLAVSAVVFFVVVMLLVVAIFRARERRDRGESPPSAGQKLIAFGGVIIPAVILTIVFILVLKTMPSTGAATPESSGFRIKVVGRQWFWDVIYPDPGFKTANELHIPVGRPVHIDVTSTDVIHSFWVPRLNRKIDMIPGQTNSIDLFAREPGVYRGQCAEFCGLQHALMAFWVVAEPESDFDAWLEQEAQTPSAPTSADLKRGRSVFMNSTCVSCHTIEGTPANKDVGPDLTHFGSRLTIGAGTVSNNRGNLGGWIINPQTIKPGNKMPPTNMSGTDLQALLDYLESLK
jgi:cytochrome c oxidase subunit 2